jgi:hypothetical protein
MKELLFYILDEDKNVVATKDTLEWGRWFETHREERIIKQTKVLGIWISTVFLGLDHNFFLSGEPLVFETMIFGGALDQYQDRYSTLDQSIKGHRRAIWLVIKTLPLSLIEYLKSKLNNK